MDEITQGQYINIIFFTQKTFELTQIIALSMQISTMHIFFCIYLIIKVSTKNWMTKINADFIYFLFFTILFI